MKKSLIIFLLLILSLIFIFSCSTSAKFVRVTSELADIQILPDKTSIIIGEAFKNDIFEFIGEDNEWIKINIFSGEYRYIHQSFVQVLEYGISAPFSDDLCPLLMQGLVDAEDKSLAEANDKYPITNGENVEKNIEYERILLDRYKLKIFHEFDLQPIIYQIAVTRCIEGSQSKIGQKPTYIPVETKFSQEKVEKPLTEKVKSQIEVNNIVQIIKKNAKEQWGNNTVMVNYEVEQQTTAYNWYISEDSYPNILKGAKNKWGNNYVMVKYEYKEQVSAYEWLERYTNYPSILESAKNKWGNNYVMVNYEYEEQVSAYEWLQKNKNINPGAFKIASNKWGSNFVMVKYEYEEMCK